MMQDNNVNFFETQKAFYEYWEDREVTKGSGYKLFKRWEYWMERKVASDGTRPPLNRNIKVLNEISSGTSNIHSATGSLSNGNWSSLGPSTVPSGYNGYRGLGRVNAIAFHPTNANVVYAGAPSGGLWVTENNGVTWTTHTDGLPSLGISSIAVDYTNPLIIYIGTGDRDHGDAPGVGVWKSTDGGLTFQPVNSGMEYSTVGKLIMHPTNPAMLIAATSDGLFRTINGGLTWNQVRSGNFKDVVFKPGDPNIVYATASGSFYRSINNGSSFALITSGLPSANRGAIAVSQANPEVVYFILTGSNEFSGLYRSLDSGVTFSVRSTSPNIMSWGCYGGSGGQAWYDLDIACDPVNADIIYAGGVNCFKSVNGGQTWTINSHWWGDCGVPAVHADLHVLEYNPLNNRLYAGNDGGVYWTSNGGTTWNEISNGLVISQAYKIGQSATVKDAVINGYQDNGTSTFIGNSWVNVNGGDGMQCAYDPFDNNYSYSTIYYGDVYRHYNNEDDGQIAGNGVNGITESGAWVTPFVIDHNDGNVMFIGYNNIWRSTNIKANYSGSVTWTKISNINTSSFDEMAQSRVNTNILYASDGNKLYRSDNVKASSVTWSNLTNQLPNSNYITAIETSPADENIVYIVMQNQVFKSSNKGQTWSNITGNLPNVQMHSIVYYKNSNEGLYLGTDIGVFYRDANNQQWIQYSDGLPAAIWITELEIYYGTSVTQDILRAGTFGRGLWESPLIQPATPPGPAGPISGISVVCKGDTGIEYTIAEIPNAVSYVWTLPVGANGVSNTNTILVDFGMNALSGEISVYGVNEAGNGVASAFQVTVNSVPEAAGTISGNEEVCAGETGVQYSITEIPGAEYYNWAMPEGVTGNSQTNMIELAFNQNALTGLVTVEGVNNCGTGISSALQVVVKPIPETPVVTQSGRYLTSSSDAGNQWYDHNGIIEDATDQIYEVLWDGDYYTIVTLNECESEKSNVLTVIVSSTGSYSFLNDVKIYPNPFNSELIIEYTGKTADINYEIYTSTGVLIDYGLILSSTVINTEKYHQGLYLIKLSNGERSTSRKIIKN